MLSVMHKGSLDSLTSNFPLVLRARHDVNYGHHYRRRH